LVYLSDDEYGEQMMSFNTSFSWKLLDAMNGMVELYNECEDWNIKFYYLACFTKELNDHDSWMFDHEGDWEGDVMLKELGSMWKKLMKKTDGK
jgi:hypothetical protein